MSNTETRLEVYLNVIYASFMHIVAPCVPGIQYFKGNVFILLVRLFLSFSYIHNNFKYVEDSTIEFDLAVSTKALLWGFAGKKKTQTRKQ